MKELITCPRSNHKSSKRVIALVFCGAAVLLSFFTVILITVRPDISSTIITPISTIITVFAGASAGTQATTMQKSTKTTTQEPSIRYGTDYDQK
jgi:cell division protein FtsW (lipid II flippase)